MAEAAEAPAASPRGTGPRAFAIFCAVAGGGFALYAASAALFAGPRAFLEPTGGVMPLARFNAALILVLAYLCAALWLGRRWVLGGFDALRGTVAASEAEWAAWSERLRARDRAGLLRAVALGAAGGVLVDVIGGRTSAPPEVAWSGHVVWVWLLNPIVFGVMGALVWYNRRGYSVWEAVGRRAVMSLGDREHLAPFARLGLRLALLWFLGTSLASLLLVDTDAPLLVLSILAGTTAAAALALVSPSRGVHERLREVKRDELAWLRAEIARASDALRRGDAGGAALLPALLAWEERVRDAPEWPFDTSTWLRFALLLLVPLGSWLGGALVEYGVERWLGA